MLSTRKLRSDALSGDVLVLIAMAMFATYSLFLRLFPDIPTLAFLFAFQLVGALCFLALGGLRPLPSPSELKLLAALAIVAIGNDLFYFWAFRTTTVANATVAHQSVSIFLIILAPAILGERTERDEWWALGLSVLGIAFLYSGGLDMNGRQDILGISMGLASGLCFAFVIVLYRIIPARGLTIRRVNFWRYGISTVMLAPFMLLVDMKSLSAGDLTALTAFAVAFAVIASGIHHVGLSKSRSLHASILGKSEPVFAVAFAFMFLGEQPTSHAIIGGILITAPGVWLAIRSSRAPSEPALSIEIVNVETPVPEGSQHGR